MFDFIVFMRDIVEDALSGDCWTLGDGAGVCVCHWNVEYRNVFPDTRGVMVCDSMTSTTSLNGMKFYFSISKTDSLLSPISSGLWNLCHRYLSLYSNNTFQVYFTP